MPGECMGNAWGMTWEGGNAWGMPALGMPALGMPGEKLGND
jgi:hypothetical protein